jgi:hypothetical protein
VSFFGLVLAWAIFAKAMSLEGNDMKNLLVLTRRARLALQEFGPYMALLMLPGGYLIALSVWVHSYWPAHSVRT